MILHRIIAFAFTFIIGLLSTLPFSSKPSPPAPDVVPVNEFRAFRTCPHRLKSVSHIEALPDGCDVLVDSIAGESGGYIMCNHQLGPDEQADVDRYIEVQAKDGKHFQLLKPQLVGTAHGTVVRR